MAAPKGNQFWKLRSKHGRDKLFATPDLLWQAACEYFEWCDKHPWYKSEAIKNGKSVGKIVKIPTERHYSLKGFQVYIGTSQSYWYDFKAANHIDFSCVISEIEKIIETQQFEGAAVGAFNANIISRKLGLIDKQNISTPEGEAINIRSTIDTHRIIFENYDNEKEE